MEEYLIWENLSNLYQVSKTLRFELKPIGKTLENIKNLNGINLIEEDNQRDNDFQKVKKIMDNYYKEFINKSFNNILVNFNLLEEYKRIYLNLKNHKDDKRLTKDFLNVQKKLRNELSVEVSKIGYFKYFFKKDFIQKYLPEYLEKEGKKKDLELVKRFNNWTTYFTGFYENRKNIFTDKEIPTSIFYRIVNDNLPKFINNLEKIKELNNFKNEGFLFDEIENSFKSELNNESINQFFNLSNFKNLLNQKGIEKINLIIGGKSLKNGEKIKGLNEYINLFSQQNKDNKNIKKLKLVPLFKQILSDENSNSFIFESIESEDEVIKKISNFYSTLNFKNILKIFDNLKNYNLNEIYIKNDNTISAISQKLFNNYDIIKEALLDSKNKNIINLNIKEEFETQFKKIKYFSIFELEKILTKNHLKSKLNDKNYNNYIQIIGNNLEHPICSYFSKNEDSLEISNKIIKYFEEFKRLEKNGFKKETENDVENIKLFLDEIKELFYFIKPLYIDLKRKEKEISHIILKQDDDFYIDFNKFYESLSLIIPLYNKVRNFITKKKSETKKFKLNFQKSTLLSGWDKNKETSNLSIILRKDNVYYLGIMNLNNNKIFKKIENNSFSSSCFEKINYKLLPGPEKMLPKVFFSNKNIDFFNPSKEILKIRNYSTHTKNGNAQKGFEKKDFNLNDCHKMIKFFINSLNNHQEWKNYNFKFQNIKNYNDISQFYKDVSDQGYKISFQNIDLGYITKLVNEGKLYLFKIWNKDFSEYSKGKNNLHTLYWKELFSKKNIENIKYKLNGEAEIFYRKASIPFKITHNKNIEIENKDPIDNKLKSIFKYDLIKNKRYTTDKFLFHCPITLNFKSINKPYIINKNVNEIISKNNKDINILSIDRGERHLAYYTLLDSKGNIKEQNSFNIVSNKIQNTQRKINYHNKLDKLEAKRDEARKSWKKIENIKDLKEGYLSQIIHKIAKIVIDKNAIIVLEDLNFGFKRGRFKIEKQVYQKFEKMLIEKLNYLVFKDISKNKIGGILKAYQLTSKFESFQKIGKQTGIIYYIPANFTSKICPKTGFINLLYPKFENIISTINFFKKFEYIKYNKDENLFEFNFNYSKFIETMKKNKLTKDNWSIYSNGIKLKQFRNKEKNLNWDTKKINVTNELINLFESYNIDYVNNSNLIENICKTQNKYFLETLIYNLKLILQIRNSYSDKKLKEMIDKNELKNESEGDYILSCVKDKTGNFFDSRNAKENEPKDADANGAFNIGLKGLMIIDKIKNLKEDEKLKAIKRDDFINFVINKNK